MEELKELLKNVSDSYYDFVVGICRYVRNVDNGDQMMIDFIKEHPKAKSDDIIEAVEAFGML